MHRLSLLLKIEVNVVCLLFVCESTLGVDNLTVVPLSVVYIVSCTDDGDVYLTATSDNVIPVDEVDVSEKTEVELTVLDGKGFASAKEYTAEVTVGIHGGVVTGLVYVSTVLSVDGTGMTILMLLSEVGDHLSHDVEKVVLEVLEIEGIDIVRALLNHNGAGGVVRNDSNGTVLNTGVLNHLKDFLSDVVEGGDPASGLELEFFLINLEFHCS